MRVLGGARRASGYQSEKRQLQGLLGDELDSFSQEVQRRPQVKIVNKYVVVMAFIRIGLKGFGTLALLWATVVLLGGFVSVLKGVDFRNLTIIAFVQAAGSSNYTGKMVIDIIPHDRSFEVVEKHDIVATLLKASKRMAGLETSMLFAGVDRNCHRVPLKPLSSDLAKQAQDLLRQRKQELGISIASAGVP